MDIKNRIKDLRIIHNMSQEQLAEKVGTTKQAISQYERGIRKPKYEILEAIADYFNVDYDYLIGMDTPNIRNMNRIAGGDPDGKIYKLLSFAGSGRDVADPWYTGDFDSTYRDVVEGLEGFFEFLREQEG